MLEKKYTPRGYWNSKEGLERAVTQIQVFYKKGEKKLVTLNEFLC